MNNSADDLEDVVPEAASFVRSIAEQGYKLETALADLIDNSIAAGSDKIEILVDTQSRPFILYLADNGNGMKENELKEAMRFPSSSVDKKRRQNDLGRFGLGLKTASFSQTRSFSVISKSKRDKHFFSRTWDLNVLEKHGWKIKVDKKEEVNHIVNSYKSLRSNFIGDFEDKFDANTLVVWRGLYKFENYISERDIEAVLSGELSSIINRYLSIVFHRFMEQREKPLKIRVNNIQLKPFNPFVKSDEVRIIRKRNRMIGEGAIDVQSFVLPIKSIEEVKNGNSNWVPDGKSLMDMEGIYLYRADRIILFGSWLGLAKRSQRMQLARMKIDVSNSLDHLMHLNISKSQVEMPRDLIEGLKDQVDELNLEAEREYLNRTIQKFPAETPKKLKPFLTTTASNRGAIMQINSDFSILQSLQQTLDKKQKVKLSMIIRMFEKELNSLRKVHEAKNYLKEDEEKVPLPEFIAIIDEILKNKIYSKDYIKENIIEGMGFNFESLPADMKNLLD